MEFNSVRFGPFDCSTWFYMVLPWFPLILYKRNGLARKCMNPAYQLSLEVYKDFISFFCSLLLVSMACWFICFCHFPHPLGKTINRPGKNVPVLDPVSPGHPVTPFAAQEAPCSSLPFTARKVSSRWPSQIWWSLAQRWRGSIVFLFAGELGEERNKTCCFGGQVEIY